MNKSIPYNGKLHMKIVEALKERRRMWHNDSADRRRKWADDEKNFQSYVHETTDDKLRKSKAEATGDQEYTQIVIPYSYGLIMAFHTYISSVFLARQPILQYQERHGAGDTSVQAIEAIMDYQTGVGSHLVPYYIWLMDATKHGLGVIGTYWDNEVVRVSKIIEETPTFGGFSVPGASKRKIKRTVEIPGYRGNRVYNIRPQDFIFDTRVSLGDFQTGEFAGRILDMSWLDITDGEQEGRYMNVDKLKQKSKSRNSDPDELRDNDEQYIDLPSRGQDDLEGVDTTLTQIPDTGRQEGYELVVRLVPKNWALGKSSKSEKWVFTVINDVIIECRPLGELHDKFPYTPIETEITGYALFKRSMMEIAEPLNDVLSWLVNTHFFNIRKSLNNMFVADPSRVVMKDFQKPDQGLAIRLRPEAYGTPIGSVIQQFQTQDVTATHMQDTKVITEMMQITLGINSQLMGMLESTGRKTATEVRGSTGFSMNRLKTQAEYMSAMGMAPHSMMMVQSTQQHLDIERYYKLTGDLLPGQETGILVSPEDITGFFDYVPVDGTMPVDKLALANLWKELMTGVASSEVLMQKYDVGKIFAYTAQLSGAKNINRFKVQLEPDDVVARERAAGNLVPLSGAQNVGTTEAFSGPGPVDEGRLVDSAARVNEPKQLSGVGPVS